MMKKWIEIFFYISLFCLFIWYKIFKEHLPKHIPLDLIFISFIFLIISCLKYFIMILMYFKQNVVIENNVVSNIKNNINIRITALITKLNDNVYFKQYSVISATYLIKHINTFIIFEYTLKFFVCIIFFLDIFYFSVIFYTYKILINLIILIILKSYLYIILILNNITKKLLETKIDLKKDLTGSLISLNNFIELQVLAIINKETLIKYEPWIKPDFIKKRHEELNLAKNYKLNIKFIMKNINKDLNNILLLEQLLVLYQKYTNKYNFITLIINIIYFLSWFYILVISLHTLNLDEILNIFNKFLLVIEEPFSGNTII